MQDVGAAKSHAHLHQLGLLKLISCVVKEVARDQEHLQEENEVAFLEHLNGIVTTELVLHHLYEHEAVHVFFKFNSLALGHFRL